MANNTQIDTPELSDAQIKYGILAYLANKYAGAGKLTEPFCNTRSSTLGDIFLFLKYKSVCRYDLDRTLWDKDRSKMPNPFHTKDRDRVEALLFELQSEGMIDEHRTPRTEGYIITKQGAEALGDTVLAGAIDSKMKCGNFRKFFGDAVVPKVWDTMPEPLVAFANVSSTTAAGIRMTLNAKNTALQLGNTPGEGISR